MMTITRRHIRAMDLNLLPVLAALFETRGVTRASVALNVTQPAVSRALQRLRKHFNDPLFVRGQGGLVPTSRALAIEPVISQMLSSIEGLLVSSPFDPKTIERELVVTGSDYCEHVLLPPLLRALRERAPGLTVRLTQITDRLWEYLEEGTVDLVVLPEQRMQPNVQHRFLFSDPYVCIAAARNPHLRGELDLDAFCKAPHIQVKAKAGDSQEAISPIDTLLGQQHRQRRVVATVSTQFSVGRIVSQSDLIATLPRRVAEIAAETLPLKIHPLPLPLWDARIALGWHLRCQSDPAHKFFRDLVVKTHGGRK